MDNGSCRTVGGRGGLAATLQLHSQPLLKARLRHFSHRRAAVSQHPMHELVGVSSLFLQMMQTQGSRAGLANHGPSLVFVNEVLLKHSHAHLLCVTCCCFHVTVAEMSHFLEAGWPTKSKVFLYRPSQKKFANCCFRGRILFAFHLASGR